MTSGWHSIVDKTVALLTSQINIFISPPEKNSLQKKTNTIQFLPALSKTLSALGCQSTCPTRRWCATRSTVDSLNVAVIPPSGICQILTVQSSEPLAMTLSLCGHHAISSTAALWPLINGTSRSIRPTLSSGKTRNAPPPADSVIIATNFGLTEQNVESHALFVIRILS
jgi:hypothetical protein